MAQSQTLLREVHKRRRLLRELAASFNTEAWEDLQKTLLGKTILFTDDDWSAADIVRACRGQHAVETTFPPGLPRKTRTDDRSAGSWRTSTFCSGTEVVSVEKRARDAGTMIWLLGPQRSLT